jgi:hypothetical protein
LCGKTQNYDTKYTSVYNDLVVVYEKAVMNLSEFKIKLSPFEVLTMVYDV